MREWKRLFKKADDMATEVECIEIQAFYESQARVKVLEAEVALFQRQRLEDLKFTNEVWQEKYDLVKVALDLCVCYMRSSPLIDRQAVSFIEACARMVPEKK